MAAQKIAALVVAVMVLFYCTIWVLHLIACLSRKEFKPVDKFFWFAVLMIPVIGLILYRGLVNEYYKSQFQKARRK